MNANQLKTVMFILLLAVVSLDTMNARSIKVRGIVTDAKDSTLIVGCTVRVKGTTRGAVSGLDGKYAISAEKGDTLVFNYIGYKEVEKRVNTKIIDVCIEEDPAINKDIIIGGEISMNRKMVISETEFVAEVPRTKVLVNNEGGSLSNKKEIFTTRLISVDLKPFTSVQSHNDFKNKVE